ncbi:major facilitator superfamily domain-containing protein [Microdochium trichocladiopsis]|uniref:Major facilitator superfamily domain-containing protein n=1 Tax=Microdochium trichocladiopsis TaxID=1682393 RepID=A0A9P8XUU5_9PEZI|nr:major facilitator superfamily domain-containing protein [Microdochium trichocladiopsis]KAH7014217.1 major facilitator superfamily domain-containing protein [Microdochium trichocladiopsis]
MAAATAAFFSPLTASVYLPALPTVAKDFGVSLTDINLTVTTYMIFQGLTPMFVGAFADSAGRRPAYMFCFVVYMAANIGCALAPNYVALLILRMLQSAGSSTTVALAQGVVSDIITSAERGRYIGYMSLPIMLGPSLGPVLGGALAEYLGWRWIFWILTIMCGCVTVAFLLWMPETCRGIVGDGSVRPKHLYHRSLWQVGKESLATRSRLRKQAQNSGQGEGQAVAAATAAVPPEQAVTRSKFNAFRALTLLVKPSMAILLFYSSLVFANFYCIMTSIPAQFSSVYHLTDLQTGLIYLPLGLGTMIGSQLAGRGLDWNFRRHCQRLGIPYERKKQTDLSSFPLERARLEIGIPVLVAANCLVLIWGWVLYARTHIAVPCVMLCLLGITLTGFSNTINTLIVDMNPTAASAATASNNFTRCLMGAAASAAIQPMIEGVGPGWAFTILVAISTVAAPPTFWLVLNKGMGWRKEEQERKKKRAEELEKKKREGVEGGEK